MSSNDWGLTEHGFRRPTYPELLDALEYKARELFGAKANLTTRSPLGIFLRILVWALNLLFQLIEDVYNSRFVDTAVGASLYNLGRMIGLKLLPAGKANGYVEIRGSPGTRIPKGFLVATRAGFQYVVVVDAVIPDCGVLQVPVQAVNTGPDGNTAANTITEIVNPLPGGGIDSVTNPLAVEDGRDRETDEEFRDRYYKSVDFAGGVNIEAICAEVLQSAEATSVRGYENDSDYPDARGLPGHSFEIIAHGGIDAAIATAIFRRKGAGIQAFGSITIPVVAMNGQVYDIGFSRPDPLPVWVRVDNLLTSDKFPEDGTTQVIQAIIDYIGSNSRGGLQIGESLVYNQLPSHINAVPGVLDYDLTISDDGETFSRENILVGLREKAVTDEQKVVVTLV